MTRSEIMARIRSKDTGIEVSFRKTLWSLGLRFRKHYGRPSIDVAFPRRKVAIMLDGCFWHGCPIHGSIPKTNTDYWMVKLARNKERDRLANSILRERGWRIVRIWECQIGKMLKNETGLKQILQELQLL